MTCSASVGSISLSAAKRPVPGVSGTASCWRWRSAAKACASGGGACWAELKPDAKATTAIVTMRTFMAIPPRRRRVTLADPSLERLAAAIRQREDEQSGRQKKRRGDTEREPDTDAGQRRCRADRVRRDRARHASHVVARALPRRAHWRGKELRDEAAEHAEVAVAEVTEQRAQDEQHHRAARHLAVDRDDRGGADHEQDEGAPPAEPISDEAERQVAEIRADLRGDDPVQRADDAHSGAALLEGAREKLRQPEEQPPVRELHGAAERDDAQRPAEQRRAEDDLERVLRLASVRLLARRPLRRLADVAADPEHEHGRHDARGEQPTPTF